MTHTLSLEDLSDEVTVRTWATNEDIKALATSLLSALTPYSRRVAGRLQDLVLLAALTSTTIRPGSVTRPRLTSTELRALKWGDLTLVATALDSESPILHLSIKFLPPNSKTKNSKDLEAILIEDEDDRSLDPGLFFARMLSAATRSRTRRSTTSSTLSPFRRVRPSV